MQIWTLRGLALTYCLKLQTDARSVRRQRSFLQIGACRLYRFLTVTHLVHTNSLLIDQETCTHPTHTNARIQIFQPFHISFLYMKGDAILWGEPRHTSFKCSIDSPSICASPSFLNTCMPSHAPVVTWVAFFSLSLSLPLSPSLARCKRQRLRLEWRCNGSLTKQGPSSRTASEHRTSSGGKPNHLGNKPPSIGLRMSGFKMNFGQPNRG